MSPPNSYFCGSLVIGRCRTELASDDRSLKRELWRLLDGTQGNEQNSDLPIKFTAQRCESLFEAILHNGWPHDETIVACWRLGLTPWSLIQQ
jgi:hypothetical protein